MSIAHQLSNEIKALEDECARHERDSKFYARLLIQLAMMNGGSIKIDPAFGIAAVDFTGCFEINNTGFHITKGESNASIPN